MLVVFKLSRARNFLFLISHRRDNLHHFDPSVLCSEDSIESCNTIDIKDTQNGIPILVGIGLGRVIQFLQAVIVVEPLPASSLFVTELIDVIVVCKKL